MDLIYFGNGKSSECLRKLFRDTILKQFPKIEILNADYDIKGLRLQICYKDHYDEKDIQKWLIKEGWSKCSLNLEIMIIEDAQSKILLNYIDEIKIENPNIKS